MNSLSGETSPCLLQHAHNPVQWYPWGDEALQRARNEDKPILLSIGYSACHWCHVMEHESFENEEIATLMNENFINIKVDREDYRRAALRNAGFILSKLQRDGRLLRTCKDGQAKYNGYLEDYACIIDGLISLYEATFDQLWIREGERLADLMIQEFWDPAGTGFILHQPATKRSFGAQRNSMTMPLHRVTPSQSAHFSDFGSSPDRKNGCGTPCLY